MSRQIKFRAWDNTKLEWIDVKECSYTDLFEDEKYTVQQWTGLKDKKGNLIYEGDVIIFLHEEKYINSEVVYVSRFATFAGVLEPNEKNEILTYKSLFDVGKLEVVGNIFENSELLKQ